MRFDTVRHKVRLSVEIWTSRNSSHRMCLDLDHWRAKSLQLTWESVRNEECVFVFVCIPPLCVYLQSRADLTQLSQLHLDRQLIQSWRRLTGDDILSNSSTTNSIISSMLISVSPPLASLLQPIILRLFTSQWHNLTNHSSACSYHHILKHFSLKW